MNGGRVNYPLINRAELEIYGKVITKTDWRGVPIDEYKAKRGDINDARRPAIRSSNVVDNTLRVSSRNANTSAGYLGKPSNRSRTTSNVEVWTSNKHIIIDRGDTYNIIEGEGLE